MMMTPTAVFFQVEGRPHHAVLEPDEFLRADVCQPFHARNAITGLDDAANIAYADLGLERFDLLLKIAGDLLYQVCHFASTPNGFLPLGFLCFDPGGRCC